MKRFVTFITEHFLILQKDILVKLDYEKPTRSELLQFCGIASTHDRPRLHIRPGRSEALPGHSQ